MIKAKKTKTNLETDALNLAIYFYHNFHYFREQPAKLTYKSKLAKKIQSYLDANLERIKENELKGIIAVRDVYKNATGGRIHLIPGMLGPIAEVFQKQVLLQPIDYEGKHKCLIQATESVSEEKAPKTGNIHFHPFHCSLRGVQPSTILEFIRKEHGYQNELQQVADSQIFVLIGLGGAPYWRPANREIVYNLFSHNTNKAAT